MDALTVFGAYSAWRVSKRWFESSSIPGYSAYEANQRTLKTFGSGERPPEIVVFHTRGNATKEAAIRATAARAAAAVPRARTSSFFSTGSDAVSKDGHTTFVEVHPVGENGFGALVILFFVFGTLPRTASASFRRWGACWRLSPMRSGIAAPACV